MIQKIAGSGGGSSRYSYYGETCVESEGEGEESGDSKNLGESERDVLVNMEELTSEDEM